jgi:hypothetical protein
VCRDIGIKVLPNYFQNNGNANFQLFISALIVTTCADATVCCGASDYPITSEAISICNLNPACFSTVTLVSLSSSAQCQLHLQAFIATVMPLYCTQTTTTTTTTTTATPLINKVALPAAIVAPAVVGILAVGAFAAVPMAPSLVTTQGVPPNNPPPGTPNGGGIPSATSATSVAALALVPFGLVPVAVFPPFAR